MAIEGKTTMESINSASMQVPVPLRLILSSALKVGLFIWHYLEMMLAMMLGATLFELLAGMLPKATSYTINLRPGTYLYTGGIALAMMVVMVGWMVVRGHGWRHSAEMSVAMLVPVAVVALISLQKGPASVAWFDDNYCSAMCVGMFAAMLYRWDHFIRWSFRSAHHHH